MKQYGLIYLATPYTKYPAGIHQAFVDASKIAADLLRSGLVVYSPIVHTHPIAMHGDLDPRKHDLWLPFDKIMMGRSDALLVAMMSGWQDSFGIKYEIDVFASAGKPVHYLHIEDLSIAA